MRYDFYVRIYSAYTSIPARMPAELTSPKNPLLKDVRRAIARGGLTSEGCCVAETFHLVEEALRSNCLIQAIIASESVRSTVERRFGGLRNIEVIRIPDNVFTRRFRPQNRPGCDGAGETACLGPGTVSARAITGAGARRHTGSGKRR